MADPFPRWLALGALAWLVGMTAFRAVCAARLPIPHDETTFVCVGSPPAPLLSFFVALAAVAVVAAWRDWPRAVAASAALFCAGTMFPVLLSELREDLATSLVPSAVLLLAAAWRARRAGGLSAAA